MCTGQNHLLGVELFVENNMGAAEQDLLQVKKHHYSGRYVGGDITPKVEQWASQLPLPVMTHNV